eukprot:Pgem_evm1s16487
MGIKPEDQAQLLDAFYQVNQNGPNGGTGLGLSITSALIGMMRGTGLDVQSEFGNG